LEDLGDDDIAIGPCTLRGVTGFGRKPSSEEINWTACLKLNN